MKTCRFKKSNKLTLTSENVINGEMFCHWGYKGGTLFFIHKTLILLLLIIVQLLYTNCIFGFSFLV